MMLTSTFACPRATILCFDSS